MNNRTGEIVPFDFSRASGATLFDKNFNLQLVEADIPRIDFGNYSKQAKILIEKESTNLVLNSVSGYTVNGGTYSVYDLDPSYNIFKEDASSNRHRFYRTLATFSDVTVSYSTSVKTIDRTFLGFRPKANGSIEDYWLNMNAIDGTVTGQKSMKSYRVEKFNDDFRLFLSFDNTGTVTPHDSIFSVENGYETVNPLRNFTGENKSWLCRYSQMEIQTEPTSYIPTTDSQVTRTADLLSYTLNNDCSVYLSTTKQDVILNKSVGIWNIDQDLNNEGIYCIAIFENELTNNDKIELQFFNSILSDGGIVNKDSFLSSYNNLSEQDKSADIIILPGVYKEGVVYGMDSDFSINKLEFSRASGASQFDKNYQLEIINSNIPRIDYGNYSNDVGENIVDLSTWERAITLEDKTTSSYNPYYVTKRFLVSELPSDRFMINNNMTATTLVTASAIGWRADGSYKLIEQARYATNHCIIDDDIVEIAFNIRSTVQFYVKFYTVNKNPKILIEKEATNYIPNANFTQGKTGYWGAGEVIDVNDKVYNYFDKVVRNFINQSTELGTYFYTNAIISQIDGDAILSTFVYNPNHYTYSGEYGGIGGLNTSGFSSQVPYSQEVNSVWDRYDRSGTTSVGTSFTFGSTKSSQDRTPDNVQEVFNTGFQAEAGLIATSYIPTTGSQATRAADLLSINLESNCTIKLNTTKQNIELSKNIGKWIISDDLNNEGIYSIIINKG